LFEYKSKIPDFELDPPECFGGGKRGRFAKVSQPDHRPLSKFSGFTGLLSKDNFSGIKYVIEFTD
jgi:hypothetical protein